MIIVLKKGLYCEGFGYLPPMTELRLPPDSAALGVKLVERGYAEEQILYAVDPETWETVDDDYDFEVDDNEVDTDD